MPKNRKPLRPDAEHDVITVDGEQRKVRRESFVSLVRGALRSRAPNIKDRRERIEEAIDEANKGNK